MRLVDLPGFEVLTGTYDEAADWLLEQVRITAYPPVIVAHLNIHNCYLIVRDLVTKQQVVANYQLLFDGIGMKIGAALLGCGWLPDLNGTDLFVPVMRRVAESGIGVFLLGGTPPVIQKVVQHCTTRYATLRVMGYRCGYFEPSQYNEIVREINRSGAELLIIARGSSMQTELLLPHLHQLGVRVIWNVGGLFDLVSGAKRRAPLWLRGLRLEWLFRLVMEPRRMWRRNLIAAPWIIGHLLWRGRMSGG
jgi:exopolysaccharide biosynthesis WecB/TagA/CpsF family protein